MLSVTIAVNEHEIVWCEARRQTEHPRPLPAGTHAYRWTVYERRQELRCTGTGVLFHDEADGALVLATKLLRSATRPAVAAGG